MTYLGMARSPPIRLTRSIPGHRLRSLGRFRVYSINCPQCCRPGRPGRGPGTTGVFHRKDILMATKYVYFFGGGKAEGRADMKELLGGKGANLAEMTNIGLPVPAGFTLTTEVCTYYTAHDHAYPPKLKGQVEEAMKKTEQVMGAKFGDPKNPLLVSCRSGARVSMPGM